MFRENFFLLKNCYLLQRCFLLLKFKNILLNLADYYFRKVGLKEIVIKVSQVIILILESDLLK